MRTVHLISLLGIVVGCGKPSLTPCETLVDELARAAGQAASDAADDGKLRGAIQAAVQTVTALELRNDYLAKAKADYLERMTAALKLVGAEQRNRGAMDRVNAATVGALDTINLFCASQR